MDVAILMDPLAGAYPGETTHYLGRELARRGHAIAYCTPADVAYEAPAVTATVRALQYTPAIPEVAGPPERGKHLGITAGEPRIADLATFDVVLARHDPPVDGTYLALTYVLERLAATTLVVNDPRAVRDTAEKLSILGFPELAPPTLVTVDLERLRAFRAQHGDLVIKQLFGKSGDGLFFLRAGDKNWNVVMEQVAAARTPVMAQPYVDAPSKKVVVIEGEVHGAVEIELEPDDIRGNLDRGKAVRATTLSAAERAAVGPVARWLGERGIVFAVVDLLGAYVIETNVTSPGICFYFNAAHGTPLERAIVDAIEAAHARRTR
jgi:glutathione synthase